MAGRYQGCHVFEDTDSGAQLKIEVLWQSNGWFWRRVEEPSGNAVGPFMTSTEAYESAKGALFPRA
jgi:hypothetical protein